MEQVKEWLAYPIYKSFTVMWAIVVALLIGLTYWYYKKD